MWKKEFQMTVETFRYLLGLVGGKLERIYSFFKKNYKRGEDFRCFLLETFLRKFI